MFTMRAKLLVFLFLGRKNFIQIFSLISFQLVSSSSVSTLASTGSCGDCMFPFIFGDRIHESCTTFDGDTQPWCSTKVDSNVSGGGHWEYCTDSSCPGTSVSTTQQMSVNPLNAPGSCCKFPYIKKVFEYKEYSFQRLWRNEQNDNGQEDCWWYSCWGWRISLAGG